MLFFIIHKKQAINYFNGLSLKKILYVNKIITI